MPEGRLERTRKVYLESRLDKRREEFGDILRPALGLTPFIDEGRAALEALIPNRFKENAMK